MSYPPLINCLMVHIPNAEQIGIKIAQYLYCKNFAKCKKNFVVIKLGLEGIGAEGWHLVYA